VNTDVSRGFSNLLISVYLQMRYAEARNFKANQAALVSVKENYL